VPAPTIRSFSEAQGAATVVVPAPATIVEGDLLLCVARSSQTTSTGFTNPDGWATLAMIQTGGGGGNGRTRLLSKVATASEPSDYTFVASSSAGTAYAILAIADAVTTLASLTHANGTGAIDPAASDTVTAADYLALVMIGADGKAIDWTPATGYTQVAEIGTNGGGPASSHASIHVSQRPLTGATSEDPAAFSSSAGSGTAFTVLVEPAASGPQTLPIAADLDGAGDLTAAQTAALALTADLDGAGDLSGSVYAAFPLEGALDGAGDLTSAITRAALLAGDADGAGDLTSAITRTAPVASDADGSGDLANDLTRTAFLAGDADGAGDLNVTLADGAATLDIASDLDGTSDLTSAITRTAPLASDHDGAGDLAAAQIRAAALASDLDGVGDVTAAISRTAFLAGDADGAGDLSVTLADEGALTLDVAADLDGSGDLTAALHVIRALTLTPSATLDGGNLVDQDGLSAALHAAVSDPPDASDGDSTYMRNTLPENDAAHFALTLPPNDLAQLRTLTVHIRARRV
jgi:hypothetical protein